MLLYCPLLPYIAATFLLHLDPVRSYEIAERDDLTSDFQCPAFLIFDTAAFLSDMTFELPCHCKPTVISSVVWYYRQKAGKKKTRVLTDFNGTVQLDTENVLGHNDIILRFSIRMFNLIVFKAQLEDSGLYMCGSQDGQIFYGYDVDIQNSKYAYIAFEEKHGHPQPELITKYFVSFTTFWEWTMCDRCDVRGEQRRIGLCYINSTYLDHRYHTVPEDVASCGSDAVPPKFKKLIATRRPEVIIRSCTTPCYEKKKGILGKFNSFIHTLSKLKDYIPWLTKVPTQIHTHAIGTRLTIACPGGKPEHAVAWDKGDQRLYRTEYLIGNNKSMRVFIDHGNHLNFRSIEYRDKGMYYCWLQGKMVAGFRLAVQRDPATKRHFNDPESTFAMKIIGISFVFFLVFFLLIHFVRCCFLAVKPSKRDNSSNTIPKEVK